MAMSHRIALTSKFQRERAARLCMTAPEGFIAEVREPKRTQAHSEKMWAMLTDISHAKPMDRRHTPDDWKAIAMNACGWECQFTEGLDGRPFPQGFRSSQLTKSQMSALIDWLQAFGDEHEVQWSEPTKHESKAA
jgi:hypothetical protein